MKGHSTHCHPSHDMSIAPVGGWICGVSSWPSMTITSPQLRGNFPSSHVLLHVSKSFVFVLMSIFKTSIADLILDSVTMT